MGHPLIATFKTASVPNLLINAGKQLNLPVLLSTNKIGYFSVPVDLMNVQNDVNQWFIQALS